MDVKTYIQQQMDRVRDQTQAVLQGITDEQLNWPPPGTVSPISTILTHMLAAEDYFIQTLIRGQAPYWEVQEWSRKIGVPAPPEQGRNWDEFKTVRISPAPVLAYAQAIRLATDAYLAELTAEELDRRVVFHGDELPVAQVLMILISHSAGHTGEMAAIKGMQGIKGLPY
jgi:uncharacterized damage-inducible protein DinB